MAGKPVSGAFLRFVCVGCVGFVLDGGLLLSLIQLGFDPFLARLVSFPLAVVVTWLLNRLWTFSNADRARPVSQLNRYLGVQILGALCNYFVYASVLAVNGTSLSGVTIGFTLGSALGMFVNFVGARLMVFRP